jgi:pyruvate formate lyase activating enzyme
VRENRGGRLFSNVWGRPVAVNIDPVEKKPLYHFMPGTSILSIGTAGCNMGCHWCQNHDLSRSRPGDRPTVELAPDRAVAIALSHGCPSIAFTYNEPTIFAEYAMDIAAQARPAGLRLAMVTNGYVTPEACDEIYRNIDAANVDLKAFRPESYEKWTCARLEPVLDALVLMKTLGVWIEITTLLIPGLNDDPAEIRDETRWIRDNLGPDTPLHLSAFHPDYHLTDRPRTPLETLHRSRAIALDNGLHFVYEGNVQGDGAHTVCPGCGEVVIRRAGMTAVEVLLDAEDRCRCGRTIPIRR